MANCGTTSSRKGLLRSIGWATTCSATSRLISSSFTLGSSLSVFVLSLFHLYKILWNNALTLMSANQR